jgi:hypothetical protein
MSANPAVQEELLLGTIQAFEAAAIAREAEDFGKRGLSVSEPTSGALGYHTLLSQVPRRPGTVDALGPCQGRSAQGRAPGVAGSFAGAQEVNAPLLPVKKPRQGRSMSCGA